MLQHSTEAHGVDVGDAVAWLAALLGPQDTRISRLSDLAGG